MASEKYLKKQNSYIVILFVAWCVTVYVVSLYYQNDLFDKLLPTFKDQSSKGGLLFLLSPIVLLVCTGLISSANKARLVFWRLKNALPGHRAFSKLVKSDPRIDFAAICQRISPLPSGPAEENAKWYSIYKKYSETITVQESHRSFLLARDLSAVSFLFFVFGTIFMAIYQNSFKVTAIYASVMALHYIVLAIVAQNHGNRFVCNVLVEFSNNK